MNSDNSYIFFQKISKLRIALYGTSKLTENFIESFSGDNIVGILDGYKTDGIIYEKRIISLTDCVRLKVNAIIICARKNSAAIVASRIFSFCEDNGIFLYDDSGNDLLATTEVEILSDDYFERSESDLIERIKRYDIISFDIFDTLICRKLAYSTDIFYAVDEKARKLGVPHFFVNRLKFTDASYPLSIIYSELKKSGVLSERNAKTLCEFEYELDRKVMLARKKMHDLFTAAKKLNKQIYLTSDTWYDKKQLSQILSDFGFNGYADIIASCECGKVKSTGLFEKLKDKIGRQTCLHIGDDYEADEIAPHKYGIDTFLIKSPVDMMTISNYQDILRYDNTFSNRLVIGLFASRIFNNPFALYGSSGAASVDNPLDIGYLFAAPVLSGFVFGLTEYARNKYKSIFFLSRDGFLPIKMYQMLASSQKDIYPAAMYFYTSRVACVSASIKSQEDFDRHNAIPFEDTNANLLSNRFVFEPKHCESGCNLKPIIQNCERLRDNYHKHAANMDFRDALIVDFVAGGTCQALLSEIFGASLDGYYFKRLVEEKYRSLDIMSYIKYTDSFAEEIYLFLENVIGSAEPSLKCFDDNGLPIFFDEKRSNEQLSEIAEIQEGILSYFECYMRIIDINTGPSVELCDTILRYIKKEYTNIANLSLFHEEVFDEFTNRRFNAFPDKMKGCGSYENAIRSPTYARKHQ